MNVGASKNNDWLYDGTEEIGYKDRDNQVFMPRFHDERYWLNLPSEGTSTVTATPAFRSASWDFSDYYETFMIHLSNIHIGWGKDSSPEMSLRGQESFRAILPYIWSMVVIGGVLIKCMFLSKGNQWVSNNVAPIAYRTPAAIGMNGWVVTGILAAGALYWSGLPMIAAVVIGVLIVGGLVKVALNDPSRAAMVLLVFLDIYMYEHHLESRVVQLIDQKPPL